MRITYRPLPAIWPSGKRTQYRERSRFRTGWNETLALLETELRHLGVRFDATIVIEAGYSEGEIRLDGLPRRDARPHDPAVVLNFDSKYGPLRYGCDTYTSHDDNLRAIALALQALRAVDRYGVTKRGEQYTGWKALPETTLSKQQAEEFIRMTIAPVEIDFATIDLTRAYRLAARRLHPDVTGARQQWDQLQRAKEVLGL